MGDYSSQVDGFQVTVKVKNIFLVHIFQSTELDHYTQLLNIPTQEKLNTSLQA